MSLNLNCVETRIDTVLTPQVEGDSGAYSPKFLGLLYTFNWYCPMGRFDVPRSSVIGLLIEHGSGTDGGVSFLSSSPSISTSTVNGPTSPCWLSYRSK